MTKYLLLIPLLIIYNVIFWQNIGDKFISSGCEYLFFVNDSVIDFKINIAYKGALITYNKGIGLYQIEDTILKIKVIEDINLDNIKIDNDLTSNIERGCLDYQEITDGLLKFHLIYNKSKNSIHLTGPILDNYKKMNRKRFLRGFLTWPWKWSFKKQHWFDPRERIVNLI